MQSGELARQAGVSSDTLRHYERLGLLAKPPRTAGGYRDYPGETLERVLVIRRALRVGFSLTELAAILKIRDSGGVPCLQVRALAESKLLQIQQHVRELISMEKQLKKVLEGWDGQLARTRPGHQARLLESLPHEIALSARLQV